MCTTDGVRGGDWDTQAPRRRVTGPSHSHRSPVVLIRGPGALLGEGPAADRRPLPGHAYGIAGVTRSPMPCGMNWACICTSSSGYGCAPIDAAMPPSTMIVSPVM